jgi:hypothetical protein
MQPAPGLERATIGSRMGVGFAAGALSHLVFQGAFGTLLYLAGGVPELVWSLEPVPPLGVPTTLNNMFWDGLWGIGYALVEPRLTARLGRLFGGIALGFAAFAIFRLVVLPLKGAGLGGSLEEAAIIFFFDLVFGVGTALLFWLGGRLTKGPARSSGPRPGAREFRS